VVKVIHPQAPAGRGASSGATTGSAR